MPRLNSQPGGQEPPNRSARDAKRDRRVIKRFPAQWIDVALSDAQAHEFVRVAMQRRRYSPLGPAEQGVVIYHWGSPGRQFLSDIVEFGLILRLMGRPDSWAQIAAWTTPAGANTRIWISLVTGTEHANAVRSMLNELSADLTTARVFVAIGEAFSGFDLPRESPGNPKNYAAA